MGEEDDNRVVVYCRVSTEEQAEDGNGLEAQKRACAAYCKSRGWSNPRVFHDRGVGGGVALVKRLSGAAVVGATSAGHVDHVVVAKVDRLFRNVNDALLTMEDWNKRGVVLHVVDMAGQTINTATAAGWLCFTILVTMAEFELKQISERTKAGLAVKKQNGEVYTPCVYGYDAVDAALVPNKEEQNVIAEMLQLRGCNHSYQEIADYLNDEKVATKQGKTWHSSTIRNVLLREVDSEAE